MSGGTPEMAARATVTTSSETLHPLDVSQALCPLSSGACGSQDVRMCIAVASGVTHVTADHAT